MPLLPERMGNVHDSLFRDTFGHPDHAGPLLRALLPPALATAVDWPSLHALPQPQVDEQQQNQQVDLLFGARLGTEPAMLYLLVEHKTRPDRWTALQVLAYVVGVWRDLRRRRPRPRHLPPILPVVVSFGPRRWRVSTDIESLLALDGLPPVIRAIVRETAPRFGIAPQDFAVRTPAEVRRMGLSLLGLWTIAALQFVAPVGHDDDAAIRTIIEWADVARQLAGADTGQQAIDALSSYLLKVTRLGRRRLGIVLDEHIGDAAMKKFESTYERMTRVLHARGKSVGKAEGKAEGRAEAILRMLAKRFGRLPVDTERRVRLGSPADFDRWLDRLLDAATLAEVFADGRSA